MLSWRPRTPDPVTAPETVVVRPLPSPDAARPGPGPQPFARPAVPPIDQASYDDLIRALATLRTYEQRLAAFEGRAVPAGFCLRPCCNEVT